MSHPLFEWLAASMPDAHATLRPPADRAAIARVEAAIGLPLPETFAALYREHDGQAEGSMRTCVFEAYQWLSLEQCVVERERLIEVLETVRRDFPEAEAWHPAWLPFAADDLGNVWLLDLASGAVFGWDHDSDGRPALGETFEAFLREYVASFETGERMIDPKLGAVTRRSAEYVPHGHAPAVDPRMRRIGIVVVAAYVIALAVFVVALERCRSSRHTARGISVIHRVTEAVRDRAS